MKASARFKMDEDLYRQIWTDWIRYVSRGRKWVIPVGFFCAIAGIAILIITGLGSEYRIIGLLLICLGVFEVIWHYWEKHKWFMGRRKANVNGTDVEILFEDDCIFMKGSFSQSECKWQGFQKVVSTGQGMFLYPQQGIYVYIPDNSLQPLEAKTEIINKIQSN